MYVFFAIYLTIGIVAGLWMAHESDKSEDEYDMSVGFVFIVTAVGWLFIMIPAAIISVKQWRAEKEKEK